MTKSPIDDAEGWKGPGEKPHQYFPDYQAMGDCRVCGHTRQAHDEALPKAVAEVRHELF